jgi:hypothetical protein
MSYIAASAAVMIAFAGVYSTAIYLERGNVKSYKALIGQCVSMPPFRDVKIVGLNSRSAGKGRSWWFRVSVTDPDGTVSEADESVLPYMEKQIIACSK